jgi:hypothetical protein
MILVNPANVPQFLRTSDLYDSVSNDIGDEFEIPIEYYRTEEFIVTTTHLRETLSTLRYWGVRGLPDHVLDFAFSRKGFILEAYLNEFGKELQYLSALAKVVAQSEDCVVKAAIQCNHFEIFEYVYCHNYSVSKGACDMAIEWGNLPVLEFLLKRGYKLNSESCMLAAKVGHADCLRVCYEYRGGWDEWKICRAVTERGHDRCLKYLLDQGVRDYFAPFAASSFGQLSCLIVLNQYGCEKNKVCCDMAAERGQLECLKFLHDHGWPWDHRAYLAAAVNGHLHCFVYLHEHGCPWDPCVADCCAASPIRGLHFLQYIHDHRLPMGSNAVECASAKGYAGRVEFLVDNGCPVGPSALATAVRSGHVQVVQRLIDHGCSLTTAHAEGAVNYVDVLRCLHEAGCPWDHNTSISAARRGALDSLRYAVEHGCPRHNPNRADELCACLVSRYPAVRAYMKEHGGCPSCTAGGAETARNASGLPTGRL